MFLLTNSNRKMDDGYNAAPTTGTWAKGDIAWNLDVLPGGYIGFVCTTAGTPGTWKGFGLVQA